MLLAPRPRSTAADLLRVAATWLAAIVFLQGIAAAQALGAGPWHRHRGDAAAMTHWHVAVERHHHAVDDASVLGVATFDDGFDTVGVALAAAFALMALAFMRPAFDARRHVWRARPAWAWCDFVPLLLRRPPRRG